MNSIQRQVLHHGSVMMLGLGLVGCSSNDASAPTQGAANNSVTNVPAPAMPGANHNMGAMGGPPAGNNAQPAPPGNDPMAAMKQHGGGPPGMPAGANNPPAGAGNSPMAAMTKQHGGSGPPGMPTGGNNSTPPAGPAGDAMAAAMMKQHGGGPPGMPAGANNPPAGAGNDPMAAMMKQHGAGGPGGKPPGNPNPGNPNPGAPTNEQMAAMMKQMGAAGGQPGGQGQNPMPTGPAGANMAQGRGPGGAGGAGGAGKSFPAGSVDDTLSKFCTAMAEGDTAAASDCISPKAKGMLGELRDGNLSEEKIEEITNLISPVSALTPSPDQVSNTRRSLTNGKNQSMTFVLKKEKDGNYKITDFTIPKPKK